jgi:hypothetical protein
MKKTMSILSVGAAIILMTSCSGSNSIDLQGTWEAKDGYFDGKKDGHPCISDYEKPITFKDDNTLEMKGREFEYELTQEDDMTKISVVDGLTKEVTMYELTEKENGNLMMQEVDDLSSCELKKTED